MDQGDDNLLPEKVAPGTALQPIDTTTVGFSEDLTYKSIPAWLAQNPTTDPLVLWQPTDGQILRRHLYVSKKVVEILNSDPPPAGFSRLGLIRFLNKFASGLSVNVSLNADHPDAELKPLRDADGIWSVKIQKPRPGWRVLGYFAAKDVLVLLTPEDRINLGNDWSATINECRQCWVAMFRNRPPTRSEMLSQCLSEPYYECQ